MADLAIRIEGLGKRYRIGATPQRYRTLRDTLAAAAARPVQKLRSCLDRTRRQSSSSETIWALKDVSLELRPGDVVGIVGRNGAGKSTLLKILSGITEPTSGFAEVRGRVGSLLEVGTGFHGELSGRENIYLNGAILGMKRAEIDRDFDRIVAFAEVEKFLDTPVKHYSSGMYLRLAFAVAAHLQPEILMVDEVLAVGDVSFQRKCLGKMGEVARQGRTVLFVSHNLTAIATLCERALWLEAGQLVEAGPAHDVIRGYLLRNHSDTQACPKKLAEDELFQLENFTLTQNGRPETIFAPNLPVEIRLDYTLKRECRGLRLGVDLMAGDGQVIWRSYDDDTGSQEPAFRPAGRVRARCIIPPNVLAPLRYTVSLAVKLQHVRWITRGAIQLPLEVHDLDGWNRNYPGDKRPGWIRPKLEWESSPRSVGVEAPSGVRGANGNAG